MIASNMTVLMMIMIMMSINSYKVVITFPGMTMSDMSRLDFFSSEVVVSNCAAMLASVSLLDTCQTTPATVNPFQILFSLQFSVSQLSASTNAS